MYALVFLPLATRLLLIFRFRHLMCEVLSEEEQDRETHRTVISALAGFTFSALLALVFLESARERGLTFSIFTLFISFLGYLEALNIQGYKGTRWHDEIGNAFMETGSFGLVLSMVGVLLTQLNANLTTYGLSILAILIWLIDHIIRLRIMWKHLSQ